MSSAAAFCTLYAVSDEIHQYFVPGRACRFGDICIDTAGSILAIVLLTSIVTIKKKRKSGEFNA
jgi:VanZ family protein